MWAGMLHLVVLNFFIGILEAAVLVKVFGLPKFKAETALIPANYFSMIVGWLLLRAAWTPLERLLPGSAPLYKGAALLMILGIASWVLSIILEWPFCALAMRRIPNHSGRSRWQQSLRASVIAQTVSYALLVPFYLLVSPISLYTRAKIEHSLAFVRPPLAMVYYISPQDGAVWRIRTDGTGRTKVVDAHIKDTDARLSLMDNGGSCDLMVVQPSQDPRYRLLISGMGPGCTASATPMNQQPDTWFSFGKPTDLRPKNQREWTAEVGFWANEGITVRRGAAPQFWDKQPVYTLAFETPFEQWFCRNATVLPNDQVVYQLGINKSNSQIVILNMRTRQLGFLVMGQGPVVLPEGRQSSANSSGVLTFFKTGVNSGGKTTVQKSPKVSNACSARRPVSS